MPVEIVINSFESGELAPEVYGRTDLPQYQRAAASLKNMIVLPNGSARKRPGTEHVTTITTTGRLIPFQVSATESHVLELTNGAWRVRDADGTSISNGSDADITTASLPTVRYVQSKFEMVIVSRQFQPKLLKYNGSTYTFANLPVDPPAGTPGYPTFATTANNRPGAVSFIDQRLVFAGTNAIPNAIFASQIQALEDYLQTTTAAVNFDANSTASADDDPVHLLALDYGFIDIKWASSTNTLQGGYILIGTSNGLYIVVGSSGTLSPTSPAISVRRQSVAGCSSVQGIVVNNFLMFVDGSNRRIRIAQFNLQTDQFETPRLNDLSTHLFESDIKEIHYQRSPHSILWVVLEDGSLIAFSYDSTGGLASWSPMVFGGGSIVKSMAVLNGEPEDTLMLLMYNEAQDLYTVEKMAPFNPASQADMFFVDSGVRKYNATAFTTVGSLDHLDGEDVSVFADGSNHIDREVESNEITLTREVNTAIVGRQYEAEIQTLPVFQAQDKLKRASRVFVRFIDTLGAKAGDSEFEEIVPFRAGDFLMDSQPALFTGMKEIPYQGRHDFDSQIRLFSDTPTPFHVLSVINRIEVYG